MIDIQAERKEIEETFTGALKVAAVANLDMYEKSVAQLDKTRQENMAALKGQLVDRGVPIYKGMK